MQQPNGDKVSDTFIALTDKPWTFSLFNALNLLEQEWAEHDELCQGLSVRVLITCNKELGFAASDIKSCQLVAKGRGLVHLETNFLGLYGADSTMPHYVLEQALDDHGSGKRTRAFLNIFNHLFYCLLYQSWKKSQLNIPGKGAQQFDHLLNAILADSKQRTVNASVAGLKTTSASGLTLLLQNELGLQQLTLDDMHPRWQNIANQPKLGAQQAPILGQTSILGERVLVAGGNIVIYLGQLNWQDAQGYFPGGKQGAHLCQLLSSQIAVDLPWSCIIDVTQKNRDMQQLGQDEILLGDCYLGEPNKGNKTHVFKAYQYRRRLSSTLPKKAQPPQ
jgi:type VI secretion system protein ImpH